MLVSKSEFARMHGVSHTAVAKWQKAGWLVLQGSKVDVEASNAKLKQYRDSTDARATRSRGKVSAEVKPETENETEVETETSGAAGAAGDDSAADEQQERKGERIVVDEVIALLPGESSEDAAERLTAGLTVDLKMPIEEAKRIKEVYLALLNRLEYEQKSQMVIDLDLAKSVMFDVFRGARDAWLNWPVKYAPLIAADLGIESDRLPDVLTAYVHKQLSELGEPDEAEFVRKQG
ncbi:hypothetical protein [Burkholderia glumae]|uniref:hypothetical protein n=1 Tax=Burkholderia glumae TaxID=337 RepID=UPI0020371095|nr:hypothetical protein [Burkholderia glumae]MCM2493424.1 hypothetical protein [Burkholderia glumae]UVT04590.1 hypothetical protein EFP20_25300 [Burkholderia glumae]